MALNTVLFDIDGLLVDSEPLWNQAATEVFKEYAVNLSEEQYKTTTGLRTKEFVHWWFTHFSIADSEMQKAETKIVSLVLQKIAAQGNILPGVSYIFDFFYRKSFKIGLATSSPPELIELVTGMAGIGDYIQASSSAQLLPYGKPHPQVYLNCAEMLASSPMECICFEDSFNGLIAAKAARMQCVVVPHYSQAKEEKWGAADLKLSSLQNFGQLHFDLLNQ